jgi:UbiD family decarboxylase
LLEQEGHLLRVREVTDWKWEIGDRIRQLHGFTVNPPALLFENVKGYPGSWVFTNGLGTYSKIAIALGLESKMPIGDIVSIFKERISNPINPVAAGTAPFKENILLEKDIDLMRLPIPWWSKEDGGRYIGTWHLNITKDPETGIRNVGIYRMQLLGPRTTAISISPKSHLGIHLTKAESKDRDLEMAVAIGVDETLIMAAAAAPPYGTDEYFLAGGLGQRPVELAKCNTVELEVPTSAEIVIEGKILSRSRIKEGPFLDYSGIPKTDLKAFVFEVSCLMHRDTPIFRGASIGSPGSEDHLLFSLLSRAKCLDFHGSILRQQIQTLFLEKGRFKAFQITGRWKQFIKGA